jgi:hypothetical protein
MKLRVVPNDSDGRAAQADGHIDASEVKPEKGGNGRNCGAGGLDARAALGGGRRGHRGNGGAVGHGGSKGLK